MNAKGGKLAAEPKKEVWGTRAIFRDPDARNANKTNENTSVRTGNGESANRRQHLARSMFNRQMQKYLRCLSAGD
jgi:hypothetical protein